MANKYQVRPELLAALIQQESGGNPDAVSNKGARGLAQIMPATAANPGFGVQPLQNDSPDEQRRFANDYLGAMLNRYDGDEAKALASYNAGAGNVDKYGGIPPFPETQDYVKKIASLLNPISSANADETPYQAEGQQRKQLSIDEFSRQWDEAHPEEASIPNGQTGKLSVDEFSRQWDEAHPEEAQQKLDWADVPGQALESFPASAGRVAKGLYETVRHPIDTAGNLMTLGTGAMQNILPDSVNNALAINPLYDLENEKTAAAAGSFYADRYGSMEGFKQALANDPAGVILDLSTVLGGGAALGRKAGLLPKTKLTTPLKTAPAATLRPVIDDMVGQRPASIPVNQWQAIREQALNAVREGEQIDPKAAVRLEDFKRLGMKPTQGQLTRDPVQFANEKNLRSAVPEIGNHIANQEATLAGRLANEAGTPYQAGKDSLAALKAYDNAKRLEVTEAYTRARLSAGRELEIPLTGLAQDYATILNDFPDNIPGGVRKRFEDLGLLTGQQTRAFTIEDSDKLLKLIQKHKGSDRPTNLALDELKTAVKKAIVESAPDGGPYAPAVKLAAERFKQQDMIPALKAVAEGRPVPDKFLQKYIFNGATEDVQRMGDLMKQTNPAVFNQIKAQLTEELRKVAVGTNLTGDATFAPERFAKKIRDLGTEKLSGFFSADEMDQLNRVARVGQYVNKSPGVAAVNTSNTLSGLMGLLGERAGTSIGAGLGGALFGTPGAVVGSNLGANAVSKMKAAREASRALNPTMITEKLSPGLLQHLSRDISNKPALAPGLINLLSPKENRR